MFMLCTECGFIDHSRQRNNDWKNTRTFSKQLYTFFILLKEICFYACFLTKEIEVYMSGGTNTFKTPRLKAKNQVWYQTCKRRTEKRTIWRNWEAHSSFLLEFLPVIIWEKHLSDLPCEIQLLFFSKLYTPVMSLTGSSIWYYSLFKKLWKGIL